MQVKQFFDAMGELETKYVQEALTYKKPVRRSAWMRWGAAAACFVLVAVLLAAGILSPLAGMTVTAYAVGTDAEIPPAGAAFATGTINEDGTLSGYPLMFYLQGSGIENVRFSCNSGQIRFTDLTGQRDEYGFAQNFTVTYGAATGDETDYPSLLVEWLPRPMMEALAAADTGIADLPADLRQDIIVLEITFANGRTATRAVTIDLQDDGSFRAAFRAYRIRKSDVFVGRADSQPMPKDAQGADTLTVTFLDADGHAVEPEGTWYVTDRIDRIAVSFDGQAPDAVQMFFTPSGTETAIEMDFLQTDAAGAENQIVISADALHRDSLMGHLRLVARAGSRTLQSSVYNVIYQP